ncbi:STAS domain-containing protein [Elongatibacter sediminis]|uniref:STAS domain-containing protein n=1 Tax=Elongatibacter sediminis TaxID=3119006 RepID=A0AAW9RBZ4_9GAMM
MVDATGFTLDAEDRAVVSGDLTLDTVAGLYRQSSEVLARASGKLRSLDLAGVGRVDSSGLALLLQWEAATGCESLEVRNAPDDLVSLARLCDAQDLLRLNGRDPA